MSVRFLFGLVVFFCVAFAVVLKVSDGDHRIQFEDLPGVQAKQEMVHWRYQIAAEGIQLMSVQSEHTMDSFEVWTKMQISKSDSGLVAEGMHSDLVGDPSAGGNGVHVELKVGPLSSLSNESLKGAPAWWEMPKSQLRSTQRMLWRGETSYAQGCYTAFDQQTQILWAYEFSRQHQVLWPRGTGQDSALDEVSAN